MQRVAYRGRPPGNGNRVREERWRTEICRVPPNPRLNLLSVGIGFLLGLVCATLYQSGWHSDRGRAADQTVNSRQATAASEAEIGRESAADLLARLGEEIRRLEEGGKELVEPADSIERVLELGAYGLAEEWHNTSEAGVDEAARMVALAQRLKTERRLVRRSLRRVMVLADWRQVLDKWADAQLELACLWSGGGTMWGHMQARNDDVLEKFLADIADELPVEGREVDPETERELDALMEDAKKRFAEVVAAVAEREGDSTARSEWVEQVGEDIDDARSSLEWQFRFAGSEDVARNLLQYCRDALEGVQ